MVGTVAGEWVLTGRHRSIGEVGIDEAVKCGGQWRSVWRCQTRRNGKDIDRKDDEANRVWLRDLI